MEAATEIKFRRDTSFRKAVFSPDSFAHPAKMDAQLLLWIVDRYTKSGDTILDPMAGSGTAMLGCTIGRNVIQVELEKKFVDIQHANWQKIRMMPQLGHEIGDCQIIQGDARELEGILADSIITSPPYAEAQSGGGIAQEGYTRDYQKHKIGGGNLDPVGKRSYMPENAGDNPMNIQRLPYGSIDSVITSPPYDEAMGQKHHSPRADKLAEEKANPVTYTDRIDNIITSPPYENQIHKGTGEWSQSPEGRLIGGSKSNGGKMLGVPQGEDYIKSQGNIGNLKGNTYLDAMLRVYHQCYKVLKPGGLMVVVTKNFIRSRKEVRLDQDTIRLCEQAGFRLLEHHYRKLPAQSFWRVIYQQKYPDAPVLDKEDILVFQKA